MIDLKTGSRIWIAAGFTDLRRGFQGLAMMVETVLEQAPFSGHFFVFRGKRRWAIPVNETGSGLMPRRSHVRVAGYGCERPSRGSIG